MFNKTLCEQKESFRSMKTMLPNKLKLNIENNHSYMVSKPQSKKLKEFNIAKQYIANTIIAKVHMTYSE